MADIKEIVVSRSCKMNIGNYESLDHFISMKIQLDELDDNFEELTNKLSQTVEKAMCEQLRRSYAIRGKKDMTIEKVARHHGLSSFNKKGKK